MLALGAIASNTNASFARRAQNSSVTDVGGTTQYRSNTIKTPISYVRWLKYFDRDTTGTEVQYTCTGITTSYLCC